MKNILLIIGIACSVLSYGQEETKEPEDTTRIVFGGMEFIIVNHGQDTIVVDENDENTMVIEKDKKKEIGDEELTYWSGFEFGPSILLNSSGTTDIKSDFLQLDPAQSFSYNWNFFEKRIPFGTDHVGLVTGLGITHSRYGLKGSNVIQTAGDSTFGAVDTLTQFNKNQLRATYLNVPLLLNFNLSKNPDKNFHIAAGVIGGVRISSKTVQKFDILGKEAKNKSKGIYNLNPFQAIATARVGYKDFGVFANYNLLPLFDQGAAEEVFPLTMGISFHF